MHSFPNWTRRASHAYFQSARAQLPKLLITECAWRSSLNRAPTGCTPITMDHAKKCVMFCPPEHLKRPKYAF
eukprot:1783902-Pleurochrysis_carterae.AAC.1